MSGETGDAISGWTTDTLRAHLIALIDERNTQYAQRFEAQEKAVDYALGAADRAVNKAELATEKRFEGVNEFRQQLADQARTFMPRAETELQIATLAERLTTLEQAQAQGGGRHEGTSVTIGYLLGGLSFLALLVTIGIAVATHH